MANCENIRGDNWSGDFWVFGSKDDNGPYAIPEDGVTQTYGQYGHEIVVTYVGPGDTESIWAFLDKVFGKWRYHVDSTGRPCWECTDGPSPYWIPIPHEPYGQNDVEQVFFAESYQITPFCGPPVVQTASDVAPTRTNCSLLDYEFQAPDPGGAPYVTEVSDCVNVVVTYRGRDAGIFKQQGYGSDVRGSLCICDPNPTAGGVGNDPTIPCIAPCTFVETRSTRDFSVVMTKGSGWTSVCNPTEGLDEDAGIPVHVSTVKHDVVWTNVPAVNEQYLENFSGTVNHREFLGYPPEGVLFVYKDSIPRIRWDGTATYDVRMQFIVKTALVYGFTDPDLNGNRESRLCTYRASQAEPDDCVYCGRIGLWNRTWFPDLCHACSEDGNVIPYPPTCTDFYYCTTNWHRVQAKSCAPPDFPAECVDNLPKLTPFVSVDLTRIFMDSIGCCTGSQTSQV